MKRFLSILLSGSILVVSASPAFSWGNDGHQTVGRIASLRIKSRTARKIAEILKPDETLASISTWADTVKTDRAGLYEKKFELLSEYDRNHWNVNRAGYAKLMEYMQLGGRVERNIDFKITHLQNWSMNDAHDQGNVMIYGRSRFWRGKSIKTGTRLLEARFENGEWYFSEWLTETTDFQRPVI